MRFQFKSTFAALALSVSAFALPAFAENPLLDSAFWEEADLAKVEAAVAAGADPVEKADNGYTPLVRAVRGEASIEIMDYLVSKGADVNRTTHDSRSTFFYIARYGSMDVIKHAIELGADIHSISPAGRNAIGYAAFGQTNIEVFEFLIAEGLDPNLPDIDAGRTPFLSTAGYNEAFDVVQYLAGISDTSLRTTDGSDAFMLSAARNENPDVVKAMFEISKDPHAKTIEHGEDALLLAAYRNETIEVFNFLTQNGFKTDAKTSGGRSALSIAAYRNSAEIIQLFLDAGNDVNEADDEGKTPLFYAAERNSAENVALLLAAGADVNAKDKEGNTPLLVAAGRDRSGAEDIIKAFVEAGADIKATNDDGVNTVLAAADIGHSIDVVKSFVMGGADVNAVDGDMMSPLMYVALKGEDPILVSYLLDSGANAKLADDFGDTAANFIEENKKLSGTNALLLVQAAVK